MPSHLQFTAWDVSVAPLNHWPQLTCGTDEWKRCFQVHSLFMLFSRRDSSHMKFHRPHMKQTECTEPETGWGRVGGFNTHDSVICSLKEDMESHLCLPSTPVYYHHHRLACSLPSPSFLSHVSCPSLILIKFPECPQLKYFPTLTQRHMSVHASAASRTYNKAHTHNRPHAKW